MVDPIGRSRILKYALQIVDRQMLIVPSQATALHVAWQHGVATLWAHIPDPDAPKVGMYIRIYGTGRPVDGAVDRYIGTLVSDDDGLVWHIFEE